MQTSNFHNLSALEKQHEICSMCWGDEQQKQILLGLRSQHVKVYDTEQAAFTMCRQLSSGSGPVIGLAKHQGAVVTAVESGVVTLWRFEEADRVTIDGLQGGESLSRLRQNPQSSSILATGGKENDLRVWDLDRPERPIFSAKNVRPDMLDLRVPVWVSDMAFMQDSRRVATCHRHSAVRLYDTASGQRRPVLSMSVGDEEPLTCMSLTHRDHQVVVGSGRGRLELCDLRMGRQVHALKGLAGGVREVQCHPTLPYSVSVSLDRFLLVHNLETRQLLHKVYLKSRLNCVLMRRNFALRPEEYPEEEEEPEITPSDVTPDDDVVTAVAAFDEGSDDDLQIVEEFLVDGQLPELRPAGDETTSGEESPPRPEKKKKKRSIPELRTTGDETPPISEKKKRRLPKLLVSGEASEAASPRKPKLPKLIILSKKKKKRRET